MPQTLFERCEGFASVRKIVSAFYGWTAADLGDFCGERGHTTVPGTSSPAPAGPLQLGNDLEVRILAIVPILFLVKCEFAVNIRETMSI